jgi:hypothetical protein
MPVSRSLFYIPFRALKKRPPGKTKSNPYLKVPGKGAPIHVPPTGPLGRHAPFPEPMVYSFIHICRLLRK